MDPGHRAGDLCFSVYLFFGLSACIDLIGCDAIESECIRDGVDIGPRLYELGMFNLFNFFLILPIGALVSAVGLLTTLTSLSIRK